MSGILEWATSSLPALLTSVTTLATALGSTGIRWVHEGDRSLVERLGKAVKRKNGEYRVIEPGFAWVIPGLDKLKREHVRQDVINLPSQTLTLGDKMIFAVSAVLRYRVKSTPLDLYNAVYQTEDLEQALQDAGLTIVRDVLVPGPYTALLEGRDALNEQLKTAMAAAVAEWGIEVLSFKLTDTDPDVPTGELIQMEAATAAKLRAMDVVAERLGCQVNAVPAVWVAAVCGGGASPVIPVADTAKIA